MPELYHPDLDVVIDVDDQRARNRRAAGWVDLDAEADQPDRSIDAAGVDASDAPDGDVDQTANPRED